MRGAGVEMSDMTLVVLLEHGHARKLLHILCIRGPLKVHVCIEGTVITGQKTQIVPVTLPRPGPQLRERRTRNDGEIHILRQVLAHAVEIVDKQGTHGTRFFDAGVEHEVPHDDAAAVGGQVGKRRVLDRSVVRKVGRALGEGVGGHDGAGGQGAGAWLRPARSGRGGHIRPREAGCGR